MVAAVLLIIGVGRYAFVRHTPRAEVKQGEDRRAAEAEANRKVEEAEKQRLAAEQERQARAAAEAEAKRKNEEAEQQRVAALRAADEGRKRADAEALARYTAMISQGKTESNAGAYDRAIADYNAAIRLDPKSALAFIGRGDAYTSKGDHDRAVADYNEAVRLDPTRAGNR
jgi:tetratricopeptide (TPR) repeat protein